MEIPNMCSNRQKSSWLLSNYVEITKIVKKSAKFAKNWQKIGKKSAKNLQKFTKSAKMWFLAMF